MRETRYWLTTPDGSVYDVTARVDMDSQGTLLEETEDDLLQFTYGNIDLTLDDRDGWLSAMFDAAEWGDTFRLLIERETGRRRPKWEPVFSGVFDVYGSSTADPATNTIDVSAYSLGKLLELAPAESLKRSVVGRTATVSAASNSVTVSDTTDLLPDDEITIGSGDYIETQRIVSVDSSTTVHTYEPFTNGFSDQPLTLKTPYFRKKSAAELARLVYGLAGITSVSVDVAAEIKTIPFASSLRSTGLPSGAPGGMAERSGKLAVWQSGNRYQADDVDTGFTNAGADAAKLDWTPYLASEPVTFQAGSRTQIRDYVDGAHPLYELRIDDDGTNYHLRIYKNGVQLVEVDSVSHALPEPAGAYVLTSFEVAAAWGEVWVSYHKTTQTSHKVWDGEGWYWETVYANRYVTARYNTSGTLLSSWTERAGRLRFVAADGKIVLSRIDIDRIDFYDHATLSRYATCRALDAWTFRKFGAYYGAVTPAAPYAVVVLDASTLATLAEMTVSVDTAGSSEATVFTKGATITAEYEGYAGGKWFTVGQRASGVVPYFDCEGRSASAALRELALFCAAHTWVDENGVGYLVGRSSAFASSRTPVEIGSPLKEKRRRSWEWAKRSVRVAAKDETGADVESIAGDTGDSANRLDVDCGIPMSASYCGVVASAYLRALARDPVPRQYDETIDEPRDGRVRLLDKVTRDGLTYLVLRVESDLKEETQDVSIAEVA